MPKPKIQGERSRFAGFVLTDAPRDRIVAQWLNEQPNASEAVKHLIFLAATGQQTTSAAPREKAAAPQQEVERRETQSMFAAGEAGGEDIADIDANDPDAAALFGAFGEGE